MTRARGNGRRGRRATGVALVVGALLAVAVPLAAPVAPVAASGTGPGRAETETVAVPARQRAGVAHGEEATPPSQGLAPFQMIGVSWAGESREGASVRVRTEAGWGEWVELHTEGRDGPDPGSREAATDGRALSAPVWVGSADAYELDVPEGPDHVEVHLVRSAAPDGPGPAALAAATTGGPAIVSRSTWGAREAKSAPTIASRLDMGIVHHTVSSNDYGPSDVPRMLRGIQAYHMDVNGWDDIGYNFLVDRFGTAWEGRAGGIDRPVVGAHARGYNTASVGVAVIGDYRTVEPSNAALDTVAHVLGWRLRSAGVDPLGTTTRTTSTGESLRAISGHRDPGDTECPGQRLYDQLDRIRAQAAAVPRPVPTTPPDILRACPPERAGSAGFVDLPTTSVHAAAAECMAWYGITRGGADGLADDHFGPALAVERGQMASFLVRLIDHVDPGLAPPGQSGFPCPSDPRLAVPADHVHARAIERLAAAGIVAGGVGGAPGDCFGPDLAVRRDQMASFIHRTLELLTSDRTATGTDYYDDDAGVHQASIDVVTSEGIANGTGARSYGPAAPVRRDQMASFLARTLDILVGEGRAQLPA
ncbi:MAG: peptidoglycan recognition protein family protein [Acidimicrobiales bacterium]